MYTWLRQAVGSHTLGDVGTGAPLDSWDAYVRELGTRLHRIRVERGLTQERLAVSANITAFTYSKLEKGESNPGTPANPRLKTLAALAEVLDVPLAELLPDRAPGVAYGR
jgi:DNA-binding XRE family transcriptional regulator